MNIKQLFSLSYYKRCINGSNKLCKLVQSNRYKDQETYKIQKIAGRFAIRNVATGRYVDLENPEYSWTQNDSFFRHCFGSRRQVVNAFNYKRPFPIDLLIEEEY